MSEDLFRVKEVKKKSLRLRRSKRKEWVEANFVNPDIDDEYAEQYGQTDGYLGTVLNSRRFLLAFGFLLSCLCIIFIRSVQLQIVQGAEYKERSDQNRLRIEHIRSDRGLIYDRYHTPLVQNIPNYVVTIQPNLLPINSVEREKLITNLYKDYFVHYTDESLSEILMRVDNLISDPIRYDKRIIFVEQLKQEHAILMQIQAETIPAVSVELFSRRHYLTDGPITTSDDTSIYPSVQSLSHILGYMSSLNEGEYQELSNKGYLFNDVIGRTGLEYTFEEKLRGSFGKKSLEVNAVGEHKQVLNQEPSHDGLSIVTSLDIEFQRAIESIVADHLERYEKERASVIVMNPNNGQILSMVSLPTFNNNEFARGIEGTSYTRLIEDPNRPLFNRAIAGEYPSGSTFKPIVAAAALQEGIVTPLTKFLSVGGLRIDLWFFPDWRAGGHGQTNIYHALADSVNTYFYMIGGGYGDFVGLGVAKISDYAKKFGLSQNLGIDLPGERPGFLPSKEWKESTKNERWYIGDTYHLSIGQGDLLVTPLQVASFFSTFANGGTVYKPQIVSAFVDQNLDLVEKVEPEIIATNIIENEHIQVIQDALELVVSQGSGKRLSTLPFAVSGKTGTAQWNSTKDPHAWFAGYAPSESPQIAFSILVEEGEEGSGITTSIAYDLLQWWNENRLSS